MKKAKEYKISSTLFYVSAVLFYLSAIINSFGGNNTSIGLVWLCLGSTFLCLGSSYSKKSKENNDKGDKFQFDEQIRAHFYTLFGVVR